MTRNSPIIHFAEDELAVRRRRTIEALTAQGLEGLLCFRQESMYYLSGYDTFGYVFFQCLYLGADGTMTLLTRAPDVRVAAYTSVVEDIRMWVDAPDANPAEDLKAILDEHGCRGRKLGVEYEAYGLTGRNAKRVDAALEGFCELEDASDVVNRLRVVKSPAELEYVHRAAVLADRALVVAKEMARPGVFDGDVLAEMQAVVFRGDGDYPGELRTNAHVPEGIESGGGAAFPAHTERPREGRNALDRHHRDPIVERIRLVSGVHHEEMLQLEIIQCHSHGARRAGSVGELAFEPITPAAARDEQVELGTAVRRPEVDRAGFERPRKLLDREALEGSTDLRMTSHLCAGLQCEEGVQEPAVPEVNLGGLDLTFPDVCEPGRKRPHHESADQNVEIPPRRAFVRSESAGELGRVPHLAVVMGQHRPESAKRFRGDRDAELGNVTLEERLHEALPPHGRSAVVRGQERARKTASEPERAPRFRLGLLQIETGQFDQAHPAGERFRGPADEGRRRTAEHEEPRRVVGPIDEHPKRLEERRLTLNLVDDHEAGQARQRLLWRLQPPPSHRALEIEERASLRRVRRDCTGERGLAALARPGQGDRGVDGECLPDAGAGEGAINEHASC